MGTTVQSPGSLVLLVLVASLVVLLAYRLALLYRPESATSARGWLEVDPAELRAALVRTLRYLLVKKLHVSASHESGPGGFQQDAADGGAAADLAECFQEIVPHLGVKRVQALRTIEDDFVNAIFLPGQDIFHAIPLPVTDDHRIAVAKDTFFPAEQNTRYLALSGIKKTKLTTSGRATPE